jgi:hypothetical protein
MWKQLENFRQKPDKEKRTFAFFISFGITIIIFIIWITFLLFSFQGKTSNDGKSKYSETASPLESFGLQFDNFKKTTNSNDLNTEQEIEK